MCWRELASEHQIGPLEERGSCYLCVGSRHLVKDLVIGALAVLRDSFSVVIIGVINHQRAWVRGNGRERIQAELKKNPQLQGIDSLLIYYILIRLKL